MFPRGVESLWRAAGSIDVTIAVLVFMMVLVFFGTLEQVHLGTWLAQKKYFSSWLVYYVTETGRWPVFLGGYSVGALWLVNLVAAHCVRSRWEWKRAGLLVTHGGLFALVLGQGLTQMWAQESQMAIETGHTATYSEDSRSFELAVTDVSDPATDTVHTVPASLLSRLGRVRHPGLPFDMKVRRFLKNSKLTPGAASPATMGLGARFGLTELPAVTSDDEADVPSAVIELSSGGNVLGVWLVSAGIPSVQSFSHEGKTYQMSLRPTRRYVPFRLHLKKFTHDKYPGTEIPKNFSSLLRLEDPERGEDRDVLIFMNNPLRYRGLTFYQASFGKGDRLSILQVVRNPVWIAPYFGCFLVCLGLGIHFVAHLVRFRRRTT